MRDTITISAPTVNSSILSQLLVKNHKSSLSIFRLAFTLMVIVLFVLFVYFISQTNAMIGDSYRLEGQQKSIKALASENSYLEVEYSKKNRTLSQGEVMSLSNFEKAERIYYINTVSEVAAR